jgi:hypothetical protein
MHGRYLEAIFFICLGDFGIKYTMQWIFHGRKLEGIREMCIRNTREMSKGHTMSMSSGFRN